MLKSFAGGRLFGAVHGAQTPWVLALPGWERTHRDFDELLAGFDAIALDLPGFGAAPPPPEAWSTARYAEHVSPILDEMGPRAVILGHSFGGRVAAQFAAAHPGRVSGLVLTGVPGLAKAEGGKRGQQRVTLRLAKTLRRAGVLGEARVERLRHKYGSADYRRATGVMRDVLVKAVNESYETALAAFGGPVELVWGAEDDQAPLAVAEAAAASCPRANLVVIAGVGHFVPRDRPEAITAALSRHHP